MITAITIFLVWFAVAVAIARFVGFNRLGDDE
jgi:hypothetical protein